MASHRARPSQVRPRPPSSGRPRQQPPLPRRPVVPRAAVRHAPEPARGMPLVGRLGLVAAIAVLVVVVFTAVTGILPLVASSFGTAIGGVAGAILRTPVPSPSLAVIPAPPTLEAPQNAYTNKATVTISGTVPGDVVGGAGYAVRIYVAVPDQAPVAVKDVAVGETTQFVADGVTLEPGRNDISATMVGPGGESESSPVITYILDQTKPKITIVSPADKATVNGATVTITGKISQAGSTVVARNEANGTAATATAAANGAFSLKLPLSSGTNGIALTATDPAGNVGTAVLSIRKGSGQLTVAVSASAYRISAAKLPSPIEIRAVVTDPNGRLLGGQAVTFTLSIPGVPALTGEDTTDGSGTATFTTTIPAGATVGQSGLATAFVSTAAFGDASGRASFTIVK